MSCRIVQAMPPNNEGEKAMFAFLKHLPPQYTLYSELRLNVGFKRQTNHLQEKKPDFVVVGEEVGVVSIEVKDWNLDRSVYEWLDQHKVRKLDRQTGEEVATVDNPGEQVTAYRYALMELLKQNHHARDVWVSSLLAFPRLTRQEFLNGVRNIDALTDNPQARFFLDFGRILFRDDLDRHVDRPEKLLREVIVRGGSFRKASGKAIYKANEVLLPPKFRVGGDVELQEAREKVALLSQQQQKWAFSLNGKANFLLDIAGSGKTNALISKAIHLVDTAAGAPPNILITTYNRNLEKGLCRVFNDKVGPEAGSTYQSVQILSLPTLLETVIDRGYGEGTAGRLREAESDDDSYERRLVNEAREVLREDSFRFARFDHVFVDEIQDFSDDFLRIVKRFAKGDSYFFVGDVGQKIYARTYDLQRLGLSLHRAGLDPSYQMYRTPRYIAELATAFVIADSAMRKEFADHGYTESFKFTNPLTHAAVLRAEANPDKAAANLVAELLQTSYPGGEENILVVASPERVGACERALNAAGVRARIGEDEEADAVTVVGFSDSKGLEREVVVVVGVEDLYVRGMSSGVFDDVTEQLDREARNRRKVYVALTRAMERLYVIYERRSHPFIQELCDLNDRIAANRTATSHTRR